MLVDGASDQLLAGAALAGDQHRHVLAGDAADGLVHLAHRRAGADEGALRVQVRLGFACHRQGPHAPGYVQSFADDSPQHGQLDGLEQEVIGAMLHGLDGRVGPPRAGNEVLVDLQPGRCARIQAEDDDVGRVGADVPEAAGTGASDLDPGIGPGERPAQLLRQPGRVFVENKQVSRRGGGGVGR